MLSVTFIQHLCLLFNHMHSWSWSSFIFTAEYVPHIQCANNDIYTLLKNVSVAQGFSNFRVDKNHLGKPTRKEVPRDQLQKS